MLIVCSGEDRLPPLDHREKVTRRQFTAIGGSYSDVEDFLGYQYGGDAQVIDFNVGCQVPFDAEITAGYRRIVHGDRDLSTVIESTGDYPDPDDGTPHGEIAEITTVFSLNGSKNCSGLEYLHWLRQLKLELGINYSTIENRDNTISEPVNDVQLTAGISAAL